MRTSFGAFYEKRDILIILLKNFICSSLVLSILLN